MANSPWTSGRWRIAVRFASLSGGLLAALALLAVCEGALLWLAGVSWKPRPSILNASIGDFAIAPDGAWGVSFVGIQRRWSQHAREYALLAHDLSSGAVTQLPINLNDPLAVAAAPNSKAVAIACANGDLFAWRPSPRAARSSAPQEGTFQLLRSRLERYIAALAFSPDGRHLAVRGDDVLHLLQFPAGQTVATLPCAGKGAASFDFAADSRTLVTCDAKGAVTQWDAATGAPLVALDLGEGSLSRSAVSADAQLAAIVAADGNVRVWSLSERRELWRQRLFFSDISPLRFSEEGRWLAVAGWSRETRNYHIQVCAAHTGARQDPRGDYGARPTIDLVGQQLFAWNTDGELTAWRLESPQPLWRFDALAWAAAEYRASP